MSRFNLYRSLDLFLSRTINLFHRIYSFLGAFFIGVFFIGAFSVGVLSIGVFFIDVEARI